MTLERIIKELANFSGPVLTKELTNAEYHSPQCPGVSSSMLKAIAMSTPLHAKTQRGNPESSSAMVLGSAVHKLVLEPQSFNDEYFVVDDDAPRKPTPAQINAKKPSPDTVVAVEFWKQVQERCKGKEVLSPSDYGLIDAMRRSVLKKFGNLLEPCAKEESIFFESQGQLCKIRPDAYDPTTRVIIDLKTTTDLSEKGFQRSMDSLYYPLQAGMYAHGMAKMFPHGRWDTFYLLAVEKEKPFDCRLFRLSHNYLKYGFDLFQYALGQYIRCSNENTWPGYSAQPTELKMYEERS